MLNNSLLSIYYKILKKNQLSDLEITTLINASSKLSNYELALRRYNLETNHKDKYALIKAIEVNLLLFYLNQELFNSKKNTLTHINLLNKLLEERSSSKTARYIDQHNDINKLLEKAPKQKPSPSALLIKNQFDTTNWWRLATLRFKRNIDALDTFIRSSNGFHSFTQVLDTTSVFFRFLAWIFYLPRLIYNIGILIKHTLSYSSMPNLEKKLTTKQRFSIQLKKRWYAISNDLVWASVGVFTCFLLTTTSAAAPVLIALYAFDLFNVSLKYKLSKQSNPNSIFTFRREDHNTTKNIKTTQCELLNFHNKEAAVAITTAFGLLIGTLLTYSPQLLASSVLAASALSGPLMPIIGTGLILVIISCQFFAKRQLSKQKNSGLEQKLSTPLLSPSTSIASNLDTTSRVPKPIRIIIHFFNTKKEKYELPSNNSSTEDLPQEATVQPKTLPIPIAQPYVAKQQSCATSCSHKMPLQLAGQPLEFS